MHKSMTWALSALALVCQPALASSVTYQATLMPTDLAPVAFNNSQTVLALSVDNIGRTAWRWTPDGGAQLAATNVWARAISDEGTIVGSRWGDKGGNVPVSISASGVVSDLSHRDPAGAEDAAAAINQSGQIAGYVSNGTGTTAVRWEANGVATPLLGDSFSTMAQDISNDGVVAGYWIKGQDVMADLITEGFVTDGASAPRMTGIPFGSWSFLNAVNDAGQAVGMSGRGSFANWSEGESRAYIWDAENGARILIPDSLVPEAGTLISDASGINNQGVVVGSFYISTLVSERTSAFRRGAFVWSETDGFVELDTLLSAAQSDLRIVRALGINDKGQILAMAALDGEADWQARGVVLTPVPEPASAALLGLGLGGLSLLAKRRRPRSEIN